MPEPAGLCRVSRRRTTTFSRQGRGKSTRRAGKTCALPIFIARPDSSRPRGSRRKCRSRRGSAGYLGGVQQPFHGRAGESPPGEPERRVLFRSSSQDLTVHDPGVRGGNAGAGGALPGISAAYNNLFTAGLAKFSQEDQVVQDGLGPRMNLNSCACCHGAPATGGSSPKINPQFAFVNGADHGNNTLPSFIKRDGPIREARFKKTNPGNMTDGGVHDLDRKSTRLN